MVKYGIIAAVVFLVLLVVAAPLGIVGYMKTSARMAGDAIHNSIPVEVQIERARDMIAELEPVIEKNTKAIVGEQCELKRLEEEISDMEEKLADDKGEILQLQADLQSGDQIYVYTTNRGEQTFSADQVKADLAAKFERFKTSEATLENLCKIRDARTAGLMAAEQKLANMQAEKQQLEVEVENLIARMQMVEAQQVASDYQFDEGELGDVKQLIDDLDVRLEVAERMVHSESYYPGEIQLDDPSNEDVCEQVAEYFGQGKPEIEMVAVGE